MIPILKVYLTVTEEGADPNARPVSRVVGKLVVLALIPLQQLAVLQNMELGLF